MPRCTDSQIAQSCVFVEVPQLGGVGRVEARPGDLVGREQQVADDLGAVHADAARA